MLVPVNPVAIRDARVSAGLTQHQLAREVGIAGGERVSKWELGTAVPRLEVLAKVARVVDVDIQVLLAPGFRLVGVARLRAAQLLSVSEAARRCHVSIATYERWERGRTIRGPTGASLALFARVMQVSEAEAETAFAQSRERK